jgi:hypothetical protein
MRPVTLHKTVLPALLRATACTLLLGFAAMPPAHAAEPASTAGEQEPLTVWQYAARNASCRTFRDGCQICVRMAGDKIGCSTPGIACLKDRWTCADALAKAPGGTQSP